MCQKTNPPAQEDTWAFKPIESPFPDNAVRVQGQQNMFVALWYKFGNPVHGYAWNNGGLVQASFPYGTAELTGKTDIGGLIQVLQYQGDHNTLGFWYEWVNYKERFNKTDDELVRCGHSMPILWTNRPGGPLLGSLDMNSQEAFFSSAGKAEKLVGKPLEDMLIIVRNLQRGPADCECHNCSLKKPPPPTKQLVQQLNKCLDVDIIQRKSAPCPVARKASSVHVQVTKEQQFADNFFIGQRHPVEAEKQCKLARQFRLYHRVEEDKPGDEQLLQKFLPLFVVHRERGGKFRHMPIVRCGQNFRVAIESHPQFTSLSQLVAFYYIYAPLDNLFGRKLSDYTD